MDSIIYLVTAISVSLMIVLLFSKTVLSTNWWKYGVTGRHSTNKENENKHSQRIRVSEDTDAYDEIFYHMQKVINPHTFEYTSLIVKYLLYENVCYLQEAKIEGWVDGIPEPNVMWPCQGC